MYFIGFIYILLLSTTFDLFLNHSLCPNSEPVQPVEPPQAEPMDASTVSPYVVEELKPLDVTEGEPVRFSCVIKGKPRKSIDFIILYFVRFG